MASRLAPVCLKALAIAAVAHASVAAAQAADVSLTDLSGTVGVVTYRIPNAVVRGTLSSREDLARLIDPAAAGTLDERLRAIQADEIVIPEMTVETGQAGGRVTITAHDIQASGIAAGRVAALVAGGSEVSVAASDGTAPAKVVHGDIGRVAIQDLDVALASSLAEPGTGEILQALYGSASLEALQLTEPSGVSLRLDRLTSRDARARRTAAGWAGAVAALASPADPVPTDRLAAILADWLGSVRLGSFEAAGLGFEVAGPDRQAARVGRIGYAEGTPALNLDEIEIGGADARLTVGHATLGGSAGDVTAGDAQQVLPGTGSIHLDTFALAGPDRNAVTIGSVDLAVTRSPAVGGLPATAPTALRFAAREIAMPLRPQDPAVRPLVDLGYQGIAGSLDGAATYDEPREELSVERLQLRADAMGEVGITARLAQVSPDLFQRDTGRAAMALLGTRVRRLDLTVENGGLAERLVARQARLTGAKPADISRQYAGAAGFGIMMALGTGPGAQTLGTAFSRFVAKPGRLAVTLTAKGAAGLGIADLVMRADSRAILDGVDVTATAE